MWKCIPIAAIACGAYIITPIPHIGKFIGSHPIPGCERQTVDCHMVWEPDSKPEVPGFIPGDIYRPYPPNIPYDVPLPSNIGDIYGPGLPYEYDRSPIVDHHHDKYGDHDHHYKEKTPIPESSTWWLLLVFILELGVIQLYKRYYKPMSDMHKN